ncbi:tyrosine-type recombinase/integrase [Halomonas salipaludis]|uniref:tyrosine-type recombinase/integrase n=1 Tax=Halomonas salipaludis TaxID=2032625 RepID=UPI001C3EEEDE
MRTGSWATSEDAYQAFTNALNKTGIQLPKGQRSHVLRHTFASHFVMNGGNLLTPQKILGHQSIQMTMRYAHLAPDHLVEAVKYGPKMPVDTIGILVQRQEGNIR